MEQARAEAKRAGIQITRTAIGDKKSRSSAQATWVKKSPVDSFANGKFDLDGFRKSISLDLLVTHPLTAWSAFVRLAQTPGANVRFYIHIVQVTQQSKGEFCLINTHQGLPHDGIRTP